MLNPTLHFTPGDVGKIPWPMGLRIDEAAILAREAVELAKKDWDSLEISWDFKRTPLLWDIFRSTTLSESFDKWCGYTERAIQKMHQLEESNNKLFIETLGLTNVLKTDVSIDTITLRHADAPRDVRELVSYAIGCMMGRYSLDELGIIFPGREKICFDSSYYRTFSADDDGIIPVTDFPWFEDDAANRFVSFISTAWPEEHLEENLDFIAENLRPRRGEGSRITIRRYISQDFYKKHLRIFKGPKHPPRPIYWLFSSGKLRAFQCLVYLHRYNEGTLSRMRTEYVIPLQGKISARIDQLAGDVTSATATSHRNKLQRERDKLVKQQAELQTFDENLRHCADQRISLDLDDGVKVNYGKFGDLLAEVKTVTGEKTN